MPLLIPCNELQPNMRLAEAFTFRGRIMLPSGKILSCEDIDILERKYPDAVLRIGDPVLDSVVAFQDDSRDRDTACTATQQISSAMTDVQKKFSNHTNLAGIDFISLRNTVSAVMEYLRNNPVSAALITRNAASPYLAEHAGNVFYLAMVLGSAVKDYVSRERQRQTAATTLSHAIAMDLLPLGLGAMLLDIGMTPLIHVFAADYQLTDQDRQDIFEHTIKGAELLPDTIPSASRMIVRWHHENYDGSGYPDKKPGHSLHIFVRIARICDAFDAATSNKFYKQPKSTARVLWEMTYGPFRKFYDPVLTKVFASVVQPFPIGAKLTLADGRTGVVVRHNRKCPFNPTMVIAFDKQGDRLPESELVGPINIGEGNDLRLLSYAGEDLTYLPETAAEQAQPVEGAAFKDLLEASFP